MPRPAQRPSKPRDAIAGTLIASATGRPLKPAGNESTPSPSLTTRRGVVISGELPKHDGDVTRYSASPFAGFGAPGLTGKRRGSARSGKYVVYYVNGMAGNPHKHRAQAGLVAAFSGGPVWGVYNAPGGFFLDVVQCGTDKLTGFQAMKAVVASNGGENSNTARSALLAFLRGQPVKISAQSAKAMGIAIGDLDGGGFGYQPLVPASPHELTIQAGGNLATAALFDRLASSSSSDVRIVAHSQGNLITGNALGALAAWKGKDGLQGITVHAVASPQVKWPAGCQEIFHYAFANDAVAYLGSSNKGPIYLADAVVAEYDPQTEEILRYDVAPRICMPLLSIGPFAVFTICAPVPQLTHNFYCYVEYYWDILVSRFP